MRHSKSIFLLCWNLILKGNHIFWFFLKINLPLKKYHCLKKKWLSHWVTVFKKKKFVTMFNRKKCLSHWVTVFKKNNGQKQSKLSKTVKTDSFWPFFSSSFFLFFHSFWPFFFKQSDSVWQTFFIKHSDSVWQTFFFF